MANKRKPGLPDTFNLAVSDPVSLGDYLDDDAGFVAPIPVKKETRIEEPKIPKVKVEPDKREVRVSEDEKPKKKREVEPPRKQVNMKPETLRRADELLSLIQEKGPQRDAATSEMFDAIIAACYEARDHLSFSGVSKRGRWGSPTAAAFVASLSEAFAKAIYDNMKERE